MAGRNFFTVQETDRNRHGLFRRQVRERRLNSFHRKVPALGLTFDSSLTLISGPGMGAEVRLLSVELSLSSNRAFKDWWSGHDTSDRRVIGEDTSHEGGDAGSSPVGEIRPSSSNRSDQVLVE